MESNFKSQSLNFSPEYEGIDWRSRLIARLNEENDGECLVPNSVRYTTDDGYGLELTQENTQVVLNRIDDSMDCLIITDPRDNQSWHFFRHEIGDEEFKNLIAGMALCSTWIISPFPYPNIVKIYLDRQVAAEAAELDDISEVPRNWLSEGGENAPSSE
jgi:hypothetical protein